MKYPSLYQINTRVWLRELGASSLDAIPEVELDRLAALGFDWIWFLGVWQTGEAACAISRRQYAACDPADVCGSCFAITAYDAHATLGGNEALQRLHERLNRHGLRLMLDFIPNHTAPDHPWVESHPDYYIRGSEEDLRRRPNRYARVEGGIVAYGRDPNFDGWPDTAQLNYANRELAAAMRAELLHVAGLCDGVRCDMAMLVLPDVFERTWGLRAEPFWPCAIGAVRQQRPDFLFLAEVYWDLEWTLHQQGFDYAYDKRLYDRLRDGYARPVADHLRAPVEYQSRLARFIENHDEPRAAATFPGAMHRAAAVLAYCAPGLRFFHQGQLEGWREHLSVHVGRRTPEAGDPATEHFYLDLLRRLPQGQWSLIEPEPAWHGNPTHANFIIYSWPDRVIAVNYAGYRGQCRVRHASISTILDLGAWEYRTIDTNP